VFLTPFIFGFADFKQVGKMRIALPYAAIVWCIALAVWIALGTAL
jgi:hypothetical protein